MQLKEALAGNHDEAAAQDLQLEVLEAERARLVSCPTLA